MRGGRVVFRPPPPPHTCSPGWTIEDREDGLEISHMPTAYEYPIGTVWQCATCGKTWVSTGPPNDWSPGMVDFRPESRRERARREQTP